MKSLGKNIKTLRQGKGWSQEQVATRLGITAPAFSKIECGLTDVNLSRLEQIATLYEMSVVDLLTFHDTEDQKRFVLEIEDVKEKLADRESEIIALQKKIIVLLETTTSRELNLTTA